MPRLGKNTVLWRKRVPGVHRHEPEHAIRCPECPRWFHSDAAYKEHYKAAHQAKSA